MTNLDLAVGVANPLHILIAGILANCENCNKKRRTYLCNWRSQCYFVLDFLEQWQRWWWTDWCMPAWDGWREETAKPSRWLFINAVCVLGQLLRGRGAVKETATACRGEGEMRMDVRMNDMEQLRKSRNRSSLKMIWNKWGNVESQNRFDFETI